MINVPTVDLAPKVVGIGNTSGRDVDKFSEFGLTAVPGTKVAAPLIGECFASFECRLVDASLIAKYSLFVLEVVKAHVATSPKYPRTLHYRGDGVFMLSGRIRRGIASISRRRICKVHGSRRCAPASARGRNSRRRDDGVSGRRA